jgi:hypothetical protein
MSVTTNLPKSNGTVPPDVPSAARFYLDHGALPIPVSPRGKVPIGDAWQQQRPTLEDLGDLFPTGTNRNVGLLLGAPSGGLVDVDLDCAEARAAAPYLLPGTGWISGRASCPQSHWWFRTDEPPDKASQKYKDIPADAADPREDDDDAGADDNRLTLVELRSTKGQTVVPPSLHPSGEELVWHDCREPAQIPIRELRAAVGAVAAAALFARHWPAKGVRHELAVAIPGALLRAGRSVDQARTFLHAVCVAAKTGNISTKLASVEGTKQKLDTGEKVTGWPTVAQDLGVLGDEIVCRVRRWLGIEGNVTAGEDVTVPEPPPWPDPPGAEAFHGLAGDTVREIEPHSEAAPVALLVQLLTAFGNRIGRTAHFKAEGDTHYLNLFVVLVGRTAFGRKGSSWGRVRQVLEQVEPEWLAKRVQGGLASGEGMVYAIRDEVKGRNHQGQGRPHRGLPRDRRGPGRA